MDRASLEHDLIDLLDGRLPPQRAARLRELLASEPALRRLVEQMAADRRGLIELDRSAERAVGADPRAVRDAVRAAMEQAEREALLQPVARGSAFATGRTTGRESGRASRGSSSRRAGPSRLAAALGLVVALGLVAGGAGSVLWLSQHQQARVVRPRSQGEFGPGPGNNDAPIAKTPPVIIDGVAGPDELAHAPELAHADPSPEPMATDAPSQEIDDWVVEAFDRLGTDPAGAWAAIPDNATEQEALERATSAGPSGVSIDDAAVLIFSRRLRLVIEPSASAPDTSRIRRAMNAATASAEVASVWPTVPVPSGSEQPRPDDASQDAAGWEAVLEAPLDAQRVGVRGALADLRAKVLAAGLPEPRFEVGDEPSAMLPLLLVDQVLWWTNPPSEWGRSVSVRVDVVVRSAGER